jgi:predicted small lipoprotein YifL
MKRISARLTSIITKSHYQVDAMNRLFTSLAACSFLFVAYGCGQSGPLYLPGNPSTIEQPPPAANEASPEEEDSGTGNNATQDN